MRGKSLHLYAVQLVFHQTDGRMDTGIWYWFSLVSGVKIMGFGMSLYVQYIQVNRKSTSYLYLRGLSSAY